MAKERPVRTGRDCAIVAEDGVGRWIARRRGCLPCRADSARAAIVQALYGERPAGAVVLLPPGDRRRSL
jgi:hypothetical protein